MIRDTREQEGQGWEFAASAHCSGTTIAKLPTGDYTIEGHETGVVIKRIGSVGEFAKNLYEDEFERELACMASYRLALLVLEFSMESLFEAPGDLTPGTFLLRLCEIQQAHPRVRFNFAGTRGKAFAACQFKRLIEAA